MITAEQFAEWKEQPVTKEIFIALIDTKKALQERLANGHTLCQTSDATHGATSKVVGQIEGLNQLLNISYEDEEVLVDVNEQTGH
jgi:hypothetical protein